MRKSRKQTMRSQFHDRSAAPPSAGILALALAGFFLSTFMIVLALESTEAPVRVAQESVDSLPSVAAAPSTIRSGRKAAAAKPAPPASTSTQTKNDTMVLNQLRQRHNGLSDRQIAELARVIVEEATRHRLEPALVMAVIHVESSGRPRAVSPVGARGLMQIMPPTGKELADRNGIPWEGPDTLLDPIVNVKLGVAYLRKLTDRYQDVTTALAAYNWGPGRIDRRLRAGKSLPKIYPERVMQAYGITKHEVSVGRS